MGQFVADLSDGLLGGALSLDGILQRTERSLTVVMMAVENGVERAFVEDDDVREVMLIEGNAVYLMPTLAALLPHLRGEAPLTPLAPENQGTAVE